MLARLMLWMGSVMAITLLITVLLSSPTTFEVELGRDASARIVSSSDSSHLDVEVVTAGESVRLQKLEVPPAVTGNIELIGKRHAWLTLSTDQAFTSATVRSGRGATLVVTVAGRDEPLRKKLTERLPELGGALGVGTGLRGAEQAIVAGRYAEAARLLEAVKEGAPAHAWALLRGADLAMIGGERDKACKGYSDLVEKYRDRTASVLANLRLVGFACPADDADWTALLASIKSLDGQLGVWVGREAALVMQTLTRPAQVENAIAATKLLHSGPLRPLTKIYSETLTARAVASRRAKPIDLVTWVEANGERVLKHPDATSIRLETARAYRELDLQPRAIAIMAPMLDGNLPKADAPLGVWSVLTDAYSASGDVNALTALSAAFMLSRKDKLDLPAKTGPAAKESSIETIDDTFAGLERRLQRLRRHLGKEAP